MVGPHPPLPLRQQPLGALVHLAPVQHELIHLRARAWRLLNRHAPRAPPQPHRCSHPQRGVCALGRPAHLLGLLLCVRAYLADRHESRGTLLTRALHRTLERLHIVVHIVVQYARVVGAIPIDALACGGATVARRHRSASLGVTTSALQRLLDEWARLRTGTLLWVQLHERRGRLRLRLLLFLLAQRLARCGLWVVHRPQRHKLIRPARPRVSGAWTRLGSRRAKASEGSGCQAGQHAAAGMRRRPSACVMGAHGCGART
eukprot:7110413-Prymnesium_polylepis.1